MFWNKKKRSRRDLKAVVRKTAEQGTMEDIEPDEVTDVIDLAAERVRATHEACQRKTDEAVENLKSIRLPEPGHSESAG